MKERTFKILTYAPNLLLGILWMPIRCTRLKLKILWNRIRGKPRRREVSCFCLSQVPPTVLECKCLRREMD